MTEKSPFADMLPADDSSRLAAALEALARGEERERQLAWRLETMHNLYDMKLREDGYTCHFDAIGALVIRPINEVGA